MGGRIIKMDIKDDGVRRVTIPDPSKCHICENYLHGIGNCKFCHFEYDDSLPWTTDNFDIFSLDDDCEWSFLQIQYRLKSKGINVLQVLNWWGDNPIVLFGVTAHPSKVAKALGVNEDCIVSDLDIGIMIINLFKEKALRTIFRNVDGEDVSFAELLEGKEK